MTRQTRATGTRLAAALATANSSARLQAALAAGSQPQTDYIEPLVARCAVEPDFFVRDMLTWALTRQEREATTRRVLRELASPTAQARSQALHTLSKLGDRRSWPAIPVSLLHDSDAEVARAAWRAAVALVPPGEEPVLAERLAAELGRGDREVQLSLSRAFVALGAAGEPVLQRARDDRDPAVAAHAIATEHLLENPDDGFDAAIEEARRTVALLAAPATDGGAAC